MSDILKSSQERSRKRKQLLAQTVSETNEFRQSQIYTELFVFIFNCQLGLSSVDELKIVLGTADEVNNSSSSSSSGFSGFGASGSSGQRGGPGNQRDEGENGCNVGPVNKKTPGEIIYRDSSTFLKV